MVSGIRDGTALPYFTGKTGTVTTETTSTPFGILPAMTIGAQWYRNINEVHARNLSCTGNCTIAPIPVVCHGPKGSSLTVLNLFRRLSHTGSHAVENLGNRAITGLASRQVHHR